jgi:hypothetical protein
MRAFIVILLVAASVHAQSLADAARKERERREHLKPAVVIKGEGAPPAAPAPRTTGEEGKKPEEAKKPEETKADGAKPAEGTAADSKTATNEKPAENTEKPKEPAKPQPPAIDPTKEWNDQVQKLRARIESLQGEETAIQLQINNLNNQIFATVIDQPTKDQAFAQVAEARQKLTAVRSDLDQTRKTLEALQLQGPPKK